MPVTNYHTVNGRLRGETTLGVRTNYLTDALGSGTATVNSGATVVNTYRYKAFGAMLAKGGAGADPKFLWVGTRGYRGSYVRARHYDRLTAQWTSRDVFFPNESAYGYARANPVTSVDPTGRSVIGVEMDSFIHIRYGKWMSLVSPWVPAPFVGTPLLFGITDRRGAYDHAGTFRGRSTYKVDSMAVGTKGGKIAHSVVAGRTHVGLAADPLGLVIIEVYSGPGYVGADDTLSNGWSSPCSTKIIQWDRVCANLLPNSYPTCVDSVMTFDFAVTGETEITVTASGLIDNFPDFDALLIAQRGRVRLSAPFFHEADQGPWFPHKFAGMAFSRKVGPFIGKYKGVPVFMPCAKGIVGGT